MNGSKIKETVPKEHMMAVIGEMRRMSRSIVPVKVASSCGADSENNLGRRLSFN